MQRMFSLITLAVLAGVASPAFADPCSTAEDLYGRWSEVYEFVDSLEDENITDPTLKSLMSDFQKLVPTTKNIIQELLQDSSIEYREIGEEMKNTLDNLLASVEARDIETCLDALDGMLLALEDVLYICTDGVE